MWNKLGVAVAPVLATRGLFIDPSFRKILSIIDSFV